MGTEEGNHDDLLDKSSPDEENKTPTISSEEEVIGDTNDIHSETESGAPNNASEPYKGTKRTGVFTVPDPLDPAMRARVDAHEDTTFEFIEFDGTCGQCGRGMNDGRPEAQCSTCGVIMHQFCFDAHVIQYHRPPAVTARIVHKDNKFFAKIKRVSEK
jgi:hypothetical protein